MTLSGTDKLYISIGAVFALMLLFPKRTAYAMAMLVSVYRHVMQIKRDEPEVDPKSSGSRPSITDLNATISEVPKDTP